MIRFMGKVFQIKIEGKEKEVMQKVFDKINATFDIENCILEEFDEDDYSI